MSDNLREMLHHLAADVPAPTSAKDLVVRRAHGRMVRSVVVSSVFLVALAVGGTAGIVAVSSHLDHRATFTGNSGLDPVRIAKRLAAQNGEPNPTDITYVRSTHHKAAAFLSGADIGNDDRPVYAVQMHGHFVSLRGGPRGRAPTGAWMSVVIDATTGDILDLGISNNHFDLSKIARSDGASGIQGHLLEVGGPASGSPRALPGSVFIAYADSNQMLRTIRVGKDGAFHVSLEPGKYTISGQISNIMCQAESVTVVAGTFTSIDVTCSVL